MDNRQEILNRFIRHVVSQAKKNLTTGNRNASKKLYNSIKGEAKSFENSIGIYFEMEPYGLFQDQGVEGTKSGKSFSNFKYTNKMPPAKAFDKWAVRKGLAPREKGGKFKSRKGLNFAIARSIFEKGIKPSLFFTKPFEAAFKNLPDEMVEVFGLEAEQMFDDIMKQNFKK
jgi:hypothetical protein